MKKLLAVGLVMAMALALTGAPTALGDGAADTLQDSDRRTRTRVVGLTGAAERPDPGDPDGAGIAEITFDRASKIICVDLTVTDITDVTGAHIHEGGAAVAGPIVVDFGAPDAHGSSCALVAQRATFNNIFRAPAKYYLNVHTDEYPAGAVRGQLTRPPRLKSFLAPMLGAREVPGPGDEDGAGLAAVDVHARSGVICLRLTTNGIEEPAAVHIHSGGPRIAGPVLVDFGDPDLGEWVRCVISDDAGAVMNAPRAHYVNVHNEPFPGGALRGQLRVG